MTDEPAPRGGIVGFPTGLTWYQHHRAARVAASASTDATDCALLLAVLGIHPGDGLLRWDHDHATALEAGADQLAASRLRGADGEPSQPGHGHSTWPPD